MVTAWRLYGTRDPPFWGDPDSGDLASHCGADPAALARAFQVSGVLSSDVRPGTDG
jgi:hypothetical protein